MSERYLDLPGGGRPTPAVEAAARVEAELGYPVYLKPDTGTHGALVHRVESAEQLRALLGEYDERRVHLAVVEKAVDLPDFRLVVLDGRLVCAWRRIPLTVVGDGVTTIGGLLARLQRRFEEVGRLTPLDQRDAQMHQVLRRAGLGLDSVPADGAAIVLADVSNLSKGGTALDITHLVAARWIRLARHVSRIAGLRLVGVDLACADISDGEADHAVLEINATPGFDPYSTTGAGETAVVDELYAEVLDIDPGGAPSIVSDRGADPASPRHRPVPSGAGRRSR